jgi:hypothetical protein
MAHTPLKMSIDKLIKYALRGPALTVPRQSKAVDSLNHKPLGYCINIFIARLCFRGIYFPQMGPLRLAESDSRKPAYSFQTPKAGVHRRAARRGAVSRYPAGHRAAARKLTFFQRKIIIRGKLFYPQGKFCAVGASAENATKDLYRGGLLASPPYGY